MARPARPLPADQVRPIHKIADEVLADWPRDRRYFGVAPYLDAMRYLDKITDKFGEDSAPEVIIYFLSNAKTWRGETARRIKQELNDLLVTR